jgi:hypothetical protein
MSNIEKQIIVGQRVHCGLSYLGDGIVCEINGDQRPGTVSTVLSGAGATGGNARFDVVFENGAQTKGTPECILRGVQWTIKSEVASAEQIATALAYAEITAADKAARKAEADAAFAAEIDRLKLAPEYAHLTQVSEKIDCCKLAIINIRADLKTHFPRVKFSVRKTSHSSVCIAWSDGPTPGQVEAIIHCYKAGKFDENGDDSYVVHKRPFSTLFGNLNYLSALRTESAELVDKAINALYAKYAANLAAIVRPTAEDFKAGRLFYTNVPGLDGLERMIRVQVNNLAE